MVKHILFTIAYEWDWATGYAYTSSLLFTCTRHTFSKKYITIISIISNFWFLRKTISFL